MFDPKEYQLLDFGDGRRLERFGDVTLDRPAPAAERFRPADVERWDESNARFLRGRKKTGRWEGRAPENWEIRHGRAVFELHRSPFGHLGVFPEQADNWDRIDRAVRQLQESLGRPPVVLNLFAYTGGSTLAAALAGAEVTHVDAAGNTVARARKNAELSGLADAPIRWIVEDALKFVKREVKRDRRYDGIILDPPSYGHGAKGQVWRLSNHLAPLLRNCLQLTVDSPSRFVLLTCHTPGYEHRTLKEILTEELDRCGEDRPTTPKIDTRAMSITAATDKRFPAGDAVFMTEFS